MERTGTEAQRYVWKGAIPLQIHLAEAEITTHPPPPPALILAPRIGYLPLLVPQIKPFFSSTLPPGVDTVWFDYKGLPLKWYIPTGVLFDLLCAEPERPWNLTVHFRGYPGTVLTPCEGEDCVKHSFRNSLKEAAYIINGNCKNVMSMPQADEVELWQAVLNGSLEPYLQVSSKLKLGTAREELLAKPNSSSLKTGQSTVETDTTGPVKTGRIPVRLYVWSIDEDFDDLEDAAAIDSWDKIFYINRPVAMHGKAKSFTLRDALRSLLPELFDNNSSNNNEISRTEVEEEGETSCKQVESSCPSDIAEIKLVRIQGIEPKLEIPFTWVVNNLMNPEYYLHVCVYLKINEPIAT